MLYWVQYTNGPGGTWHDHDVPSERQSEAEQIARCLVERDGKASARVWHEDCYFYRDYETTDVERVERQSLRVVRV